jgi:hypothetical protein
MDDQGGIHFKSKWVRMNFRFLSQDEDGTRRYWRSSDTGKAAPYIYKPGDKLREITR